MKTIFLLSLVCLMSCTKDIKIGNTYKISSGFYSKCVGQATSSFERLKPCFDCLKVNISNLTCVNQNKQIIISYEWFNSTELEEIK